MEYRGHKKWSVKPSLLGFGCMRFPEQDGHINESLATEMLDMAYKAGVNYYDTAYGYHGGESEKFVGRTMKKYPRESFYFATKLPVWLVKTKEDAIRIFEEQLSHLQTEYIDFYLLHSLDRESFDRIVSLGVVELCEQWKEEGKIHHLGFSFHDDYDAFEHILSYRDWDFCQIQYNYMDTEEQAGDKGYALSEKMDIPVVVMEPNRGGALSSPPKEILDMFRQKDPNASATSWAMRWVASHENVKIVLSGMTAPEHVEDNIKTMQSFVPLSEDEDEFIRDVAKTFNSRIANRCTGCGYCMPCPMGVKIPQHFRIWNDYHIYNNKRLFKESWGWRITPEIHANNCIECGKCEELCPQHISIREDLKACVEEMAHL